MKIKNKRISFSQFEDSILNKLATKFNVPLKKGETQKSKWGYESSKIDKFYTLGNINLTDREIKVPGMGVKMYLFG